MRHQTAFIVIRAFKALTLVSTWARLVRLGANEALTPGGGGAKAQRNHNLTMENDEHVNLGTFSAIRQVLPIRVVTSDAADPVLAFDAHHYISLDDPIPQLVQRAGTKFRAWRGDVCLAPVRFKGETTPRVRAVLVLRTEGRGLVVASITAKSSHNEFDVELTWADYGVRSRGTVECARLGSISRSKVHRVLGHVEDDGERRAMDAATRCCRRPEVAQWT